MAAYKLLVKNAKVILKTVTNAVLNISGIKDLLTGTGSVDSNNKINWTLQEYTNTAANFTSNNPVLLLGQKGIETDDLLTAPKFKIGDGVTAWNSLPYFSSGSSTTPTLQQVVTESSTVTGTVYSSPDTNSNVFFQNEQHQTTVSNGTDQVIVEQTPTSFNKNGVEIATVQEIATATAQTAVNDGEYIVNITTTFTDPSPVEAKGFTVIVRNGTATVGGTAYSVAGTIIKRTFHSGAWANYAYFDKAYFDTIYAPITAASTIKYLTADVTSVITTETVVSDFTYALAANSKYIIRGYLSVGCSGAGGVKVGVKFPSGGLTQGVVMGRSSSQTAFVNCALSASGTLSGNLNTVNSQGGTGFVEMIITTSATAGNFEFIFASTTGGQTSTILSVASYLEYIKIL